MHSSWVLLTLCCEHCQLAAPCTAVAATRGCCDCRAAEPVNCCWLFCPRSLLLSCCTARVVSPAAALSPTTCWLAAAPLRCHPCSCCKAVLPLTIHMRHTQGHHVSEASSMGSYGMIDAGGVFTLQDLNPFYWVDNRPAQPAYAPYMHAMAREAARFEVRDMNWTVGVPHMGSTCEAGHTSCNAAGKVLQRKLPANRSPAPAFSGQRLHSQAASCTVCGC